jgi:O-antigen/teichoic acid export membrane protein
MSAVAYYTAPYELVSRASIIPSSMMMVLFPAFSSLETIDKERLRTLFIRSFKYLILIMGLVLSIIFVFAREILLLWLGNEFAEKSTFVLQIFSVGVFFSSLAGLSGTLLQGIGKPRVVTIIHVLQVPVHILSTWILIKAINIEGAALSWTVRVFLSLVLLLFACWKENLFKPIFLLQNGSLKLVLVLGIISGITSVVKSFIPLSLINFLLIFAVFTVFTFIIIWNVVSQEDKSFVARTLSSLNFKK